MDATQIQILLAGLIGLFFGAFWGYMAGIKHGYEECFKAMDNDEVEANTDEAGGF